MARLLALAALAALLALRPSAAQEDAFEDDDSEGLEEAGFDFTGQVLPPGSYAAATASTLRSAEPAHTWGLWYLQRRGDNLFVQSATTGARFVLCVLRRAPQRRDQTGCARTQARHCPPTRCALLPTPLPAAAASLTPMGGSTTALTLTTFARSLAPLPSSLTPRAWTQSG